jgi:hypothetical protein
MESSNPALARTDKLITDLIGKSAKLEAKEIDLVDFSRILMKMPAKTDKSNVSHVINKIFAIAGDKMKDESDKAVLEGLRKYLSLVEEDLYQPKPRYMDAMFFPNLKNVTRLADHIRKAQKTLKICIFNLTNDDLANAVNERWQAGVDVRVISDDECMTNKGNDIVWLAEKGIPCRSDDAKEFHMHNKFAIVDDSFLITGSFNWTFQAGKSN